MMLCLVLFLSTSYTTANETHQTRIQVNYNPVSCHEYFRKQRIHTQFVMCKQPFCDGNKLLLKVTQLKKRKIMFAENI